MNTRANGRTEKWETLTPGIHRKTAPHSAGPWVQYRDAVGFEWNTFAVDLPGMNAALSGFRILHLSDLHCQPEWQTAYDDLHERLKIDQPDLIVITGDIVDFIRNPKPCVPTARRFLAGLRARCGVLGILGNHDEFLEPDALAGTPLRLIDGQRVMIDTHRGPDPSSRDAIATDCGPTQSTGAPVEIIAASGPLREQYPLGFENSMPVKTPGVPRIVLSHYPDHFRRMKIMKPDVFLSGHTHGGQICLPGMIPILRHDSLPIQHFHGVHRLNGAAFFVSRGFGFSTHNVRIFCPSEVTEIVLRAK